MRSKTLDNLLATRHWIAHIDDERNIGNSIIVTLHEGWYFEDIKNCGVNGFDTVAEVKAGTTKARVIQHTIHL
jgi:hypothetical protein